MGIWEDLRSVAAKLINRKSSSVEFSIVKPVDSDEHLVIDAYRRENIGKILTNISKFAVDETIKGVSGGIQVYRTSKEGLKEQPSSLPFDGNKNQGLLLVMEEMLANMEKKKDGTSDVKEHHKVASLCDEGLEEPLKEFSDEPVNSSAPEESGRRRIFIRSRL